MSRLWQHRKAQLMKELQDRELEKSFTFNVCTVIFWKNQRRESSRFREHIFAVTIQGHRSIVGWYSVHC